MAVAIELGKWLTLEVCLDFSAAAFPCIFITLEHFALSQNLTFFLEMFEITKYDLGMST